jgi:hypothetical protein
VDWAAIPREILGKDRIWRVLCETGAQDTQVLKQPRNLCYIKGSSRPLGTQKARPRGQGRRPGRLASLVKLLGAVEEADPEPEATG